MPQGSGRCASCGGTTTSTRTAGSAMLLRHNVMPVRTDPRSPLATRSPRGRGNATRGAGVGKPATGRRSPPSHSIQNATLSSGQRRLKFSLSHSIEARAIPIPTCQCPGHRAQRRGWDEWSRPEPRIAQRAWRGWQASDLPAVSTVASSGSGGGSRHSRPKMPMLRQ
jgi:hypothetical protein